MAGPSAKPDPFVQPKLRLDKWLVFARFFKSRDLAAEFIEDGALRINRMDYGIKYGPAVVGEDVDIELNVEAGKQ